jgi:hypothetical protein
VLSENPRPRFFRAARVARIEIAGDIAFRESTGLRALRSLPLRIVAK